MSHITIHRDHTLDQIHARESAEKMAADLDEVYSLEYHWEENRLYFSRTGVSGHIDVEESAVKVQVSLGLLLLPMRSQFEREIQRQLDELFTQRA